VYIGQILSPTLDLLINVILPNTGEAVAVQPLPREAPVVWAHMTRQKLEGEGK